MDYKSYEIELDLIAWELEPEDGFLDQSFTFTNNNPWQTNKLYI